MDAAGKRMVLIACTLASTVAFLDTSVVNVALPALREDLGGGLVTQQWAANAYLLTLGALLLVGGALGDAYGRRNVFLAGLLSFGLFSALCMAAPTAEILIVARALQGAAAAALVPMALAIITTTFEEGERARAIGLWTAWSGVGVALGPLVGGQLVDMGSWRLVFAINLPIVLVTMLIAARFVREEVDGVRVRLDWPGAFLCAASLGATTFALIQQPEAGWGDVSVWLPLAAGVIGFVGFLDRERKCPQPMLPLGLFRRRNFSVGNLETFAMYGGMGLLFFYLVIYLQQVAGYSALEAGLSMLPVTLVLLVAAGYFGRLADEHGPRFFMAAGPLIGATGLAWLLRLDTQVDFFVDVLPALVIFSLGLAMTVAPLTATVLSAVDGHEAGVASGTNNAVARLAGMIGIAVVGVLISSGFAGRLDTELEGAALGEAGTEVVEAAVTNPLAIPDVTGLELREAELITDAAERASVAGIRIAMGATTGLVALAGLLGLAIRNPRREVSAAGCAGGQLVGQPEEVATGASAGSLSSPIEVEANRLT